LHHPELGETATRLDGSFDLFINAGEFLTVSYRKTGYLPAQRQVKTSWQQFVWAPEVRLVPQDVQPSWVSFESTEFQAATSSTSSDANGSRTMHLLVPPGTSATLRFPNGAVAPFSGGTLRMTEYTVGANGPERMPAQLPCSSAYTYASELAFDEASQLGASSVEFDQAVVLYLENFLGLSVGSSIPIGSYNRQDAVWEGVPDGRVVRLVGVTAGLADLDADGDGLPETEADLSLLGISSQERLYLAGNFSTGAELLRSPLQRFSPKDLNILAGGCGGVCSNPDNSNPGQPTGGSDSGDKPNSCKENGSILYCENQALGESVPVTGTPFRLVYNSMRTRGRKDIYDLQIPLIGQNVPAGLQEVRLHIDVAGQHIEQSFPPVANQSTSHSWDGLDAFGRPFQGRAVARISLGYVYGQGAYEIFSSFANSGVSFPVSFGETGGQGALRFDLDREGRSVTSWRVSSLPLGGWTSSRQNLGGWALNVHHSYDPNHQTLFNGAGEVFHASYLGDIVSCGIGCGTNPIPFDGFNGSQSASDSNFKPDSLLPLPDGGFLFVVSAPLGLFPAQTLVVHADQQGKLRNWATSTASVGLSSLAMAPDGALLVLSIHGRRLWRIEKNGTTKLLAGHSGCAIASTGDNGPAAQACFDSPQKLAVGRDGSMFVLDRRVVRRIAPNGIIYRFAGQDASAPVQPPAGDGGPAAMAILGNPLDIAAGPRGEVYIADLCQVRRVSCDGIITTIAGNSSCSFSSGDDGPASQATFASTGGLRLATREDGTIYIVERGGTNCSTHGNNTRYIDPDGIIHTYVSGHSCNADTYFPRQLGLAAKKTHLKASEIALLEDGSILLQNDNQQWWRTQPSLPGFSNDAIVVASQDGSEAHVFDRYGRHLETRDTRLETVKYSFAYDEEGRLASVTDTHGLVTHIERSPSGEPTALVAPHGQRTELFVDSNGYLSRVVNPANESHEFSFSSSGLLLALTDPRAGLHTFTYDDQGRLIRDDDADGGFKTLTRTDSSQGRSVAIQTAMGRTNTYGIETLSNGSELRSVTNAAGLSTQVTRTLDNDTTLLSPDGTQTTTAFTADPRFGLSSLYPSRIETRLPSGLTRLEMLQRSVVLSNPLDPFSLVSWSEQRAINGQSWTSSFDLASRTLTTTSPLGRVTTQTFSDKGDLLSMTVPGVVPWTFSYDAQGKLLQTAQTDGISSRTTTLTYASSGYLSSVLDSLQQLTSFEHDAVGRVTKETRPDAQFSTLGYDAAGNLTSVTPPGQPEHLQSFTLSDRIASYTPPAVPGTGATSYAYNLDHQLSDTTHPTGEVVSHGYDAAGRLAAISTAQGTYSYSYHPSSGKLASLSAPGEQNLAFLYDGSLLTQATWSGPVAGSYHRFHDAFFRVASESVNGGVPVGFSYDADGRMVAAGPLTRSFAPSSGFLQTATLGVVHDTWTYSAFGELESYTSSVGSTPFYSVTYQRDNLGRISAKTETLQGTTRTLAYSYDLAGRLTDVTINGAPSEHYEYDPNGNRLLGVVDGIASVGTYDAQDRLLSYGSLQFTYNARGDLESQTDTSTGQVTTYQYDSFGNLRRVDLPNGDVVEYVVDGQNRRVGRKVNGVLGRGWLYRDQLQVVAELDGTGAVRQRFVRAAGEHSPDVVVEGGVWYRVVKDQVGTVVGVVSETGGVALTRRTRAFGEVTEQTGAMELRLGFAGGLVDAGTGAIRFGARDYLPAVGRWASKDQLRFDQQDGPNFYVYSHGDSLNNVDPTGFSSEPCALPKPYKPEPNTCSCQHDDNKTSHEKSCQTLREEGKCTPPYKGEGKTRKECIDDARSNAGVCAGCFKHCDFHGEN
jgi:RHS repeat-associated protein